MGLDSVFTELKWWLLTTAGTTICDFPVFTTVYRYSHYLRLFECVFQMPNVVKPLPLVSSLRWPGFLVVTMEHWSLKPSYISHHFCDDQLIFSSGQWFQRELLLINLCLPYCNLLKSAGTHSAFLFSFTAWCCTTSDPWHSLICIWLICLRISWCW